MKVKVWYLVPCSLTAVTGGLKAFLCADNLVLFVDNWKEVEEKCIKWKKAINS